MRSLTLLSVLLCTTAVVCQSTSQQYLFRQEDGNSRTSAPLHPLDERFEAKVNRTLSDWHVPGIAVAVVIGDKVFAEGYGIATFPNTPVTPNTLFYTGSTTKAFTAAAVSLLVDDNKNYPSIDWTTPLSELIRDDFVLSDEYATAHTTLEDALSHRSGLPRHDLSYGGTNATVKSIVRNMRHLPLTAQPRTTFQYCNLMFGAVGHMIETVTGKWLGNFLRERIWEPLGMGSTFFSLEDALDYTRKNRTSNLATGYRWMSGSSSSEDYFAPEEYMDLSAVGGAGAVISTVNDYAQWVRAMMYQLPPMSKAGYAALVEPRSIVKVPLELQNLPGFERPFTATTLYSLGWDQEVYRNHRFIMHDGGLVGFGASVRYLPDKGWGVILMGNTAETSNNAAAILGWHLIDEMLETPMNERFDWNATFTKAKALTKVLLDTAKDRAYPVIPVPPVPHSLPLSAYAGTYHNPGYQNMTFSVRQNKSSTEVHQYLHVVPSTRMWRWNGNLYHVSSEWFLGDLVLPYPKNHSSYAPKSTASSSASPSSTSYASFLAKFFPSKSASTPPKCASDRPPSLLWGLNNVDDEGEVQGRGRVAFKVSPAGKVERVGMELEGELVRRAFVDGKKREGKGIADPEPEKEEDIERGMVWFDRME